MKISHPYEHGPRHEALLLQSLTSDHLVLPQELEACARCREEFQELVATARMLDGMAGEEHEGRSRLQGMLPPDPGSELVEPFFRARFAERRPVQRQRRLAVRWAAAAVVLLGLGWGARHFLAGPLPGQQSRVLLGSEGSSLLSPSGPGSSFARFSWEGLKVPQGGRYKLEVIASDTYEVLYQSELLTETSWTPSPEMAAGFPDDITWSVRVVDATRQEFQNPSVRASRLRHR